MVEKGTTLGDLKERLLDISKYCPTKILNAVRNSYRGFFWNKANLEQDLLFLDHLIEVPAMNREKENFDIKNFENAIVDFIEVLIFITEKKNPEEFSFNIVSVGSFPLNLKILAINEFDFILPWIIRSDNFDNSYKDFIQGKTDTQPAEKLEFHKLFEETISDLTKSDERKNVEIDGPYFTGPAVNIELCWKCSCDHKHKVSLDFTIAIETDTTVETYFESKLSHLKNSPFNCLVEKTKRDGIQHISIIYDGLKNYVVTTNLFDTYMFAICDYLSMNIRMCYRILKFIRDVLFPRHFRQRWYFSGEINDAFDQGVSSHVLKHVLFSEVIKFPRKEHWNEGKICARISSMLTCLTDANSDSFNSSYDAIELKLRDCFTQRNFCLHNETFLLLEIIIKDLQVILLKGILPKNDEQCTTSNSNNGFYLSVKGRLFKVETSMIHSLLSLFAAKIPIMRKHELGSDILESNFAKWIYKYSHSLTEKLFLLDLTTHTPEMVEKIVGLFKVDVIVQEDFSSKNYKKKIEKFETICQGCEMEFKWALGEYAGRSNQIVNTSENTEIWKKELYSDLRQIFESASIHDIAIVHKNIHKKEIDDEAQSKKLKEIGRIFSHYLQQLKTKKTTLSDQSIKLEIYFLLEWYWLKFIMESIRDMLS
ncbi:uncharacterized protein LOC127708168 [Mytilus californianus]|uniref:uncharacterized protein LOC127708168 n=1 Tax=Mytilus californianus TaxID=6549 RepID=UPI002247221C|nr:uncharacterized protein LOC127708168 [Mytilus californianus]XP_052068971.1 uncharacterized protein LOC127708168 [Mytilus californianus]